MVKEADETRRSISLPKIRLEDLSRSSKSFLNRLDGGRSLRCPRSLPPLLSCLGCRPVHFLAAHRSNEIIAMPTMQLDRGYEDDRPYPLILPKLHVYRADWTKPAARKIGGRTLRTVEVDHFL